jgi:hypothetical protein
MPTLVMDPAPAEIDALIERRRRLGLDHRDEIWEGVYRLNPPPSHEHQAILQQLAVLLDGLARDADLEPLIQEFGLGTSDEFRVPDEGLHRPGATEYRPIQRSKLIDLGAEELADKIDWPR